jgi:hypothetical protein
MSKVSLFSHGRQIAHFRPSVLVSDDLPNMGTPGFQSFSSFGEEIVALIDGRNACD